jgi:hypothetical protein
MLQKYQFKAKPSWYTALDALVAASGSISRADLLERLVVEEASRLGLEMPDRTDPNVHNSYAKQKCG